MSACPHCGHEVDGDERPLVSVQDRDKSGGCNFCTERSYQKVIVIRAQRQHGGGNIEVRACTACFRDIVKGVKQTGVRL
jgi:hypothetical protein